MDSNCDTCAFGQGVFVVSDTGATISVNPFMESLGSVPDVKIITAALAYDDPEEWHSYILFYHQSLYIPSMKCHLLNPNQMRANDVTVNDTPLVLLPSELRTKESHSILAHTQTYTELHIPLQLEGVTSYFPTRKPTLAEVQDTDCNNCTHVHMTAPSAWEPQDTTLAENEASLRAVLFQDEESSVRRRNVQSLISTPTMLRPPKQKVRSHTAQISRIRREQEQSVCLDIDAYAFELERVTIGQANTNKRKGHVGPEELAKRWGIGIETARKTLDRTTQLAVRNFTDSMGGRRLKPIHYQLKYRRLRCEMFVDIYKAKCKSLRGNTCAAVYCTPYHWIRFDPMKVEKDVHKTLDSLFQKVGIPSMLIPDNAKELTLGEFKRKATRASCPIHPIEPHTSNANLCEDGIRETLRGFRRMMSKTNTPGVLWDDGLEYYSAVRCHTVNTIHETQGEVPQTLMTGDTADISWLAEFGWYDYVWFMSPEDSSMERKKLGRYLGPFFNEGDAMSAKILNDKAWCVNRTSVFRVTPEEARWLAEKRTVRIRVGQYPPYNFNKPVPAGMAIDYVTTAAARANQPLGAADPRASAAGACVRFDAPAFAVVSPLDSSSFLIPFIARSRSLETIK